MDALLVFDSQNNLIANKCDQQFLVYLFEFVAQNGLKAESEDINNNEVLRNLLSLLVTPFVVSQRYDDLMDVSEVQLDCFPNMTAVYYKNHEFFLLYIFENCQDRFLMQRKVNIFAQIIQFISGPIIHCFTSYPNSTQIVFKMIDEWKIWSESTTFLLESVERLFVGLDLMKICDNTLQHIFNKIKLISKFSEEIASHIYLFYGLKYITSISSANKTKISRGDMLLMVLLSQTVNSESASNSVQVYNNSFNGRKQSFFESFSNLSFKEVIKRKASKFNQYLVFLKSSEDKNLMIPHIYRKIPIEGHLFVIILSEVPAQLSSDLILIINTINNLLSGFEEKKCYHSVINLQNSTKKVKEFISKKNLNKEKPFWSLLQNLDKLNKSQIFDEKIKNDKNILNFQTEAQLSSLNNAIRYNYKTLVFDTYYNLILKVQTLDSNLLNELVFYCMKIFADYLGFFKVKNQRNMTLLGINVDIEDLIGFVYIDRTVNELIIAPIESNTESEFTPIDVNNIVVQMIYQAYSHLIRGNLSHIWTDGVYQYSYAIWFEDSSGRALDPRAANFSLDSYPSIIGGNFIQDIINTCFSKEAKIQERCDLRERSSISCYPYEIFSIYKCDSILSQTLAFKNTKKLSNKLWEIGVSAHF